MLSFEIDTSQYVRNLVGQFRAMRDACLYAIDESADEFIEEMQKRIEDSPPTGPEWFFRTHLREAEKKFPLTKKKTRFGRHIASEEGNPPRKLSGHLLRSFSKLVMFSRGHTRIIAYIDNEASYAYYLEFGSPTTGFGPPLMPRPFMEPVIYDAEVNYRMIQRVRRAMERAGHAYGAR